MGTQVFMFLIVTEMAEKPGIKKHNLKKGKVLTLPRLKF